jgi:ADP-ribosylglycohydrolase
VQKYFTGCLLGLALGDALGAKREGGVAARALWWLLGVTRPGVLRWTDDTQMALGLAQSLAEHGDVEPDALARAWAHNATWSRGYGRGALRTLKRIRRGMPWQEAAFSVFKDGSFGNGAAMRVAPLGLFFSQDEKRRQAARATAVITHGHPLGVEGAVVIAEAAHLARSASVSTSRLREVCKEQQYLDRLSKLDELLQSDCKARRIARELGNGIRAQESVMSAVYVYMRFRDQSFRRMLDFVLDLGGDTDTIGAMAGALYGAEHGEAALPSKLLERLETASVLRQPGVELHARSQ